MNDRYSIYSPRRDYGSSPNFLCNSDLAAKQGYTSLYSVTEVDAKNIVQAGTTEAFKGCVWSERLWLDVDSYSTAEVVESKLKEMEYDYIAYDSGGRGAHFGILRESAPSHLLPVQDKLWAEQHFKDLYDRTIYTHLHLFRLPGTLHEDTGRPKSLVSQQRGKVLTHAPYRRGPSGVVGSNGSFQPSTSIRSVFSNFAVMANIGPARVGNRHATLVRTAFALRDSGVMREAANWFLNEMNKDFEELKSAQEIDKIIQDAFKSSSLEKT